jgi:hypothetical protein
MRDDPMRELVVCGGLVGSIVGKIDDLKRICL